jgi:hypothetical protein
MDKKTEFPHEVRVNIKGLRKYIGLSDLIPTYCCSATPCYYVVFPATGYEGYFEKWDVKVKKRDKNGSGHL